MFIIRTRVGPSAIHGIGVFAGEDVAAGAIIWRFHPPFDQILSDVDVASLPDVCQEFLATYAYRSRDLDGKLVLCGDDARFLNHSDDPAGAGVGVVVGALGAGVFWVVVGDVLLAVVMRDLPLKMSSTRS